MADLEETAQQPKVEAETAFTELIRAHISHLRFSDFVSFLQSTSEDAELEDQLEERASPVDVKYLAYHIRDLPHSKPGFIGVRKPPREVPPLDVLLSDRYEVIPYLGRTTLFADSEGLVHMVLVPCPAELASSGLNAALLEALEVAKESINFSASNTTGKPGVRSSRGDFRTISSGISHGGGQAEPRVLNHVKENRAALDRLSSTDAIICIASWQNECYRRWMPKLHEANDDVILKLLQWRKGLQKNFPCSVFGSITYNFGPRVVCDFHVDFLNWAPGGCAITAAGSYDYTKGGHLVLEDAKVILEFPPCATVIIPSAMMTHGNLPVAPGETRISVTQYTAGGLFRWVNSGLRASPSGPTLPKTPAVLAAEDEENDQRWRQFINLYSRVSDLSV